MMGRSKVSTEPQDTGGVDRSAQKGAGGLKVLGNPADRGGQWPLALIRGVRTLTVADHIRRTVMIPNLIIRLWAATNSRLCVRDERGAGLVEYALLLVLIVIVCVAAVGVIGQSTSEPYSELGSSIG